MIVGAPGDHRVCGQLALTTAVDIHSPDLRRVTVWIKATPHNLVIVWAKERAAIVAG